MIPSHRGQFFQWNKDDMMMFVDVVGDVVGLVAKDHVRISREDWIKIKPRLMRTTNEVNHGNAETRQIETEVKSIGEGWDHERPGID